MLKFHMLATLFSCIQTTLACKILPSYIKDKTMASGSKFEFTEQLFTVTGCTDFKYKVDVYPSVF